LKTSFLLFFRHFDFQRGALEDVRSKSFVNPPVKTVLNKVYFRFLFWLFHFQSGALMDVRSKSFVKKPVKVILP